MLVGLRRGLPTASTATLRRFLSTAARRARDPYAVLGISPNDDLDAVKAAYRQLALTLHPDVSREADSADRFAEVVRAYEVIANGGSDDDEDAPLRRGTTAVRGQRVVGGVLVVSIDELRRDPEYRVYTLRLALDEDADGTAPSPSSPASGAATAGAPSAATADSDALGTETVHLVRASEWDSVGDVRRLLQQQLELPMNLRYEHGRHREGGHELIAPGGRLLGEHLFLADYEIRDGQTLYFAVRTRI